MDTDTKRNPFRAKAIAEAKRMYENRPAGLPYGPNAEFNIALLATAFEAGADWGFKIGKGRGKR